MERARTSSRAGSISGWITRRGLLLSLIGAVGVIGSLGLGLEVTLLRIESRFDDAAGQAVTAVDAVSGDLASDLAATGRGLAERADAEGALVQLHAAHPWVRDVFLSDLRGAVVLQHSDLGRPRQLTIDQPGWVKTPPAFGEVLVGPVQFQGASPFLEVGSLATDSLGLPAGLLVVRIDLTGLWSTALDVRVGGSGYAYITDRSGQLVTFRNRSELYAAHTLAQSAGRGPQAIAVHRLSFYRGISGRWVVATARPFRALPWYAVVEQPAVEALRPFLVVAGGLFVILLLVGVLYASTIRFAGSRIVTPLRSLRDGVHEMARGHLDHAVPVVRRDELGQLAQAFNGMAGQLRRAFDDLHASEERFRVLVQHAPEAILVLDADQERFIDANANALGLFDCTLEDLTVAGPWQFFPSVQPDNLEAKESVKRHVEKALDGEPEIYERLIRTRSGEERTCEVRLVRLPAVGRRLVRVSYIDITARKRAEQTLRRLSLAVEQSPALVVISDTSWTIEYVNPRFTEVTGWTRQEVTGRAVDILKSSRTPEDEYELIAQAVSGGKVWRGELYSLKKSGESYLERVSISPLVDSGGLITHFVTVKEDITEHRRLEDTLRQAQKMDSIGRLAGGVAHDFNNILGVILGNLALMRESDRSFAVLAEGMDEVERAANRAAQLTRQLLLFSRQQVLDARPLDLNEVVNSLTKMLRRLIGEDVELVLQGPSASQWIKADAGMMDQVLMNLCVNARDAMPGGGRLTIAVRKVDVDADSVRLNPDWREGRFVCLSVSDTGTGMDAETQRHIFEPFFTTKEPGKGTGLGLANVYGIVHQHRGWIQVTTAPGRGSTFQVFLPAWSESERLRSAGPAPSARGGTETILLVEDDPDLRRFAAALLRKQGYVVHEAANGVEAWGTWEKLSRRVDLLLTDMIMPGGMSGLELARRLTESHPQLRVIVTSGYNPERAQADEVAAQGIRFLPKPYSATELTRALRDCLDGASLDGASLDGASVDGASVDGVSKAAGAR